MRLLRIAVHNLNSLYGEHEVDLEGQLGDAPIFLVLGPTGAGKSTLMDAVCLALFGQTPRLRKDRTDKLDQDPRNVMSRGTGFASAQLEFSKIEEGTERRYRATWQCHRAHRRADGDLQLPRRILEHLADGAWSELVSSVWPKDFASEFDRVLEGMTVDDFKRCVLLAQGEFAAFLEASDEQRAAILERLTDTAEYQQIGARAALKRQEARRAHQDALARLNGVVLLSAESRAGIADELAAVTGRAGELSARIEEWRVVCQWLRKAGELERLRDDAQTIVRDALAERARSAQQLEVLAEHERCAPGFAALHAWRSFAGELTGAEEALRVQLDRRTRIEVLVEQLAQREAEAVGERERAEHKRSDLAPELLRATELRNQREVARSELNRAKDKARDAGLKRAERERARDELRGKHDQAKARHSAATEQVAALESARPLIESLLAMRQRQRDLVELRGLVKTRRDESSLLRNKSRAHRIAAAQKTAEAATLGAGLDDARSALARAKEPLLTALAGSVSVRERRDQLRADADKLTARSNEARWAATWLSEAYALRAATERLEEESGELRGKLAAAGERWEHAVHQRAEASGALASKRAELEHLRWARDIARSRDQLRHGEACPLCGSHEHPALEPGLRRDRDEEIAAVCRSIEAEAAKWELAQGQAAALESDAKSEQAALQATLLSRAKQLADAKAQREAKEHSAAKTISSLGMPEDASPRELEDEAVACEGRRKTVEGALVALDDAEQAEAAADRSVQALVSQLQAAQRAIEDASREAEIVEQSAGRLEEQLARETRRIEEAYEALSGQLSGNGIVASSDDTELSAAIAEAERRVTALKAAERSLGRAREGLDGLKAALDTSAAAWEASRTAQTDADAELRARELRAGELETLVASTLQGADPVVVQRELDAQVELAHGRVDEARAELATKRADLAAAAATIAQSAAALEVMRAQRNTAREKLDTALAALGLPSEQALGSKVLDPTQRDEALALRAQLERQERESRVVLRDRQGAVDEHHARRPVGQEPMPLAQEVDASIATQHQELEELLSRAGAMRHQLEEDGLSRARSAVIQAECEALGAEWQVWERLHALVGVGDGQVFRQFAQSLNLAELIGRANVHLSHLAPRYSLEQAMDAKGQARIAFSIRDDWHAGEVRPLTTLSGGETFLVSLALALSLAESKGQKLPIETLLLDEGFGTLDQDTLNVVMHTLEALQSEGRQVGIITHVEALRERIEARVVVENLGNGKSKVRVELGGDCPGLNAVARAPDS